MESRSKFLKCGFLLTWCKMNMNRPLKILGIAGSLRKKSYNRAALRAAQQLTPEGAIIETFELDGIPPYNDDDLVANPPAIVTEFKARIRAADASRRSITTRFPEFSRTRLT